LCRQIRGQKFDPANPSCTTFLPDGERYSLSIAAYKGIIAISVQCQRTVAPTASQAYGPASDLTVFKRVPGATGIDLLLMELHKAEDWRRFSPGYIARRLFVQQVE
jgi:hypothetical protein